jgi:hypothetical protein
MVELDNPALSLPGGTELVTIPPGATVRVPISLCPSAPGIFFADISVHAPNTCTLHIEARARVGEMVQFPCARNMFLPPTYVGESTEIEVPIVCPLYPSVPLYPS